MQINRGCMKINYSVLLCLLSVLFLVSGCNNTPKEAGRYLLVKEKKYNSNGSISREDLVLLDTARGEAWDYTRDGSYAPYEWKKRKMAK